MNNPSLLDEFLQDDSNRLVFMQERTIRRIAELVEKILEKESISREQLADRLGRSVAWLDSFLDGDGMSNIRDIANVFTVLGKELTFADLALNLERG